MPQQLLRDHIVPATLEDVNDAMCGDLDDTEHGVPRQLRTHDLSLFFALIE